MKQYIPIREVAGKLACSEDTVHRMIQQHRIKALKLGRQLRVAEEDIVPALEHRPKPIKKGQ